MRTRSLGLTLVAGLSIFVAACSSGAATTAPSAAPSEAASAAPSASCYEHTLVPTNQEPPRNTRSMLVQRRCGGSRLHFSSCCGGMEIWK